MTATSVAQTDTTYYADDGSTYSTTAEEVMASTFTTDPGSVSYVDGEEVFLVSDSVYSTMYAELDSLETNGKLVLNDGDIEALVRKVLEDSANNSLALLKMYATSMAASNDRVNAYTALGNDVTEMAQAGDNADSQVAVAADFDVASAREVYASTDSELPDWLAGAYQDSYGNWIFTDNPTKADLESLATRYADAASSEQSQGQMILNDLKTAQNRYDEAIRFLDTYGNNMHDLRVKIASA